jgi:hypothetical protein
MKRTSQMASHVGGFASGASLGGKVLRYRDKQNIYMQGDPAYTLFYRKQGFINYDGGLEVHQSLRTVLRG